VRATIRSDALCTPFGALVAAVHAPVPRIEPCATAFCTDLCHLMRQVCVLSDGTQP
jgi:hypothetical protein